MRKFLSLLLVLCMFAGLVQQLTLKPLAVDEESCKTGLEGKTISILGDSISTYSGISNNAAANTTLASGAVYYQPGRYGVYQNDTWWQQSIDALGMKLLVNNSWSGSCLLNTRSNTVGAYVDRCVQLHNNDGQTPDIIAIFLGTNDYDVYYSTLGSYESISFDSLITKVEDSYAYAQPSTSMEAYAISLHKITQKYPSAEVYCFTLLPTVSSSRQPADFNADVKQLADHFGAITVDLYSCGIGSQSGEFYTMMGDRLHPKPEGMDAITNAFVSSVIHNSKYISKDVLVYDALFELDGMVAKEGTTRAVIAGNDFSSSLVAVNGAEYLDVTVTMGGVDITKTCYNNGLIYIPLVTGDIKVSGIATKAPEVAREPMNFRWEYDAESNAFVSVTNGGNTANDLTMTHGSIADGTFSRTRFTMSETVRLDHDKEWIVEWKSTGTWTDTTDGALLFAEADTSKTTDAKYFYRRHKSEFLAFGIYEKSNYYNYGVRLSGTGIDATAEHVYKMVNKVFADGSNMVYMYIDGVEIGPMNQCYVGGTWQNTTSDWLSGTDFRFKYMGTTPHTVGGCDLSYVQVWEAGCTTHSFDNNGVCTVCGANNAVVFGNKNVEINDGKVKVPATSGYFTDKNGKMYFPGEYVEAEAGDVFAPAPIDVAADNAFSVRKDYPGIRARGALSKETVEAASEIGFAIVPRIAPDLSADWFVSSEYTYKQPINKNTIYGAADEIDGYQYQVCLWDLRGVEAQDFLFAMYAVVDGVTTYTYVGCVSYNLISSALSK